MRDLVQASLTPLGTEQPHPPVTDEAVQTPESILSQWASSTCESPPCWAEKGQNFLAYLASAKPQTTKPVHRNVTKELPSKVSINVRAHGAECGPPVRGASMVGTGGDRTEKPGTGVGRKRTR